MEVVEWIGVALMVAVWIPFMLVLTNVLRRLQALREDIVALQSRTESATKDRNRIRDQHQREMSDLTTQLLEGIREDVEEGEDMVADGPEEEAPEADPWQPMEGGLTVRIGRRNGMSQSFALNYGLNNPDPTAGFYHVRQLTRIGELRFSPGFLQVGSPEQHSTGRQRRWVAFLGPGEDQGRDRVSLSARGVEQLLEAVEAGTIDHMGGGNMVMSGGNMMDAFRGFNRQISSLARSMGGPQPEALQELIATLKAAEPEPEPSPEPRSRYDRLTADEDFGE